MVSNETLLALQAALFAATLVVLLRCRRSPEPPPPPLPLAVPLPDTEPVGQKRKGKTKRQVVVLQAQDRIAAPRPKLSILRPEVDSRLDGSHLVNVNGNSRNPDAAAVLILPGGNYDSCNLRLPLEVASWLRDLGLVAYVLRYRLRSEGHFWPAQMEDCELALQLMRQDAARGAFNATKLGILGFSAGGHLATVAATSFEKRPAFQILIYATTDVETPLWDPWTARLGYPGVEYNTVRLVDRRTPPVFAAVSTEDDITSYEENTRPYLEACRHHGVKTELVYAKMGPHGHPMSDLWTKPCEGWLRANHWALSKGPKKVESCLDDFG